MMKHATSYLTPVLIVVGIVAWIVVIAFAAQFDETYNLDDDAHKGE